MSQIPNQYKPITQMEKTFVEIVRNMRSLGFGRQKQLISGVWAEYLMQDNYRHSVESALLGALDSDAWHNVHGKEMDIAKLIISKLEESFLSKHTHPNNPCECADCKLNKEISILKEHL